MYRLEVNGDKFTIPKENLKGLALIKALDRGYSGKLTTDEEVIAFLNSIGIKVEEIN